ncbi:MAG TPA: recombinase family protein [bacterium]|nr:recombinase family protein [bacterium]
MSTSDKDQNPETQLLPLREFVESQAGWTAVGEYMDHASATDLRGRVAWGRLLDGASRHKIDLVLVWRLDRAFRSVLDASTTLERLRGWNVGLRSFSEPWLDTTSPFGEALYYITVAYAQLERGILSERVRAGMDRAKRQGKRLGRPSRIQDAEFLCEWEGLVPALYAGQISRAEAARRLGVGRATIGRLLAGVRNGSHVEPSESRTLGGSGK